MRASPYDELEEYEWHNDYVDDETAKTLQVVELVELETPQLFVMIDVGVGFTNAADCWKVKIYEPVG